ncbi:MAG: type II CAAX endopeptidase family protein [Candidatus Acidiferrales bacterium]
METDQTPIVSSDQGPSGGTSGNPRRWGGPDRIRLFIWLGITFLLPVPFLLALHIPLKPVGSVFTVHNELPVKGIAALAVLLASWVVSRMENRSLADYGIPPRQAFGFRFWEGYAWGFAMLSAILLVLRAGGHFRIDSVELTGSAVFRYAFAWGLVFLAVAINEELAFRGYLLFIVARRLRFWPAALILSLSFGVAHLLNPGENAFGILQVVQIGLIFCLTLRRTGNLWFAVGFHAAWDWAETFFYGTADSGMLGVGRFLNTSVQGPNWLTGGSAGPEGSVIAFLVLLLFALLIHFRFPNAVYPDRPV